jgi:hypothetical protein
MSWYIIMIEVPETQQKNYYYNCLFYECLNITNTMEK